MKLLTGLTNKLEGVRRAEDCGTVRNESAPTHLYKKGHMLGRPLIVQAINGQACE